MSRSIAPALYGFLLGWQVAGSAAPASDLLTTIEQIKRLTKEEATEELPVQVEGVVTFVNISGGFFLQDKTAGVFVVGLPLGRTPWQGQRIVVEGVTRFGTYTPAIRVKRFDVLGEEPLPEPRLLASLKPAAIEAHGCWVEFRGIVRQVQKLGENRQGLWLAIGGERLAVELHGDKLSNETSLIGARVRIRGAVGGVMNEREQWFGAVLYVGHHQQIVVEEPAPADPFALPERSFDSLLRFAFDQPLDTLVKVRGVVSGWWGEGLYLWDGARGLRLSCEQTVPVRPGDLVEATGFPAQGVYSAILEDAIYRVVGHGEPPRAATATVTDILSGRHDAAPVSLTAELIGAVQRGEATALTLRAEDVLFTAESTGGTGDLRTLRERSELRLTGLSVISEARPEGARLHPVGFRLLLSAPSDVEIIRLPPWWTAQRLKLALAAVAALATAAVAWVWTLQHRVRQQTALIAHNLQRTAMLEERSRLAREFHDTLEQELSGLALQVETAEAQLRGAPANAVATLGTVRRLVRRCLDEASRAVWDLRCQALEHGDLASALVQLVKPIAGRAGLACDVNVTGLPRRLPGRAEHELLRIAQEGVTNTIKHAGATRLELQLDYWPDEVRLRIVDDGCGFTPNLTAPMDARAHFGLIGMRERAERIDAQLQLESRPAGGTRLEVTVPAPKQPARANSV